VVCVVYNEIRYISGVCSI